MMLLNHTGNLSATPGTTNLCAAALKKLLG